MIKRTLYLDQIKPYMNTDLIKVLIGVRRSGKSTLLKQIIDDLKKNNISDDQIIYMNFEDYDLRHFTDVDVLYDHLISSLAKVKKTYIFLDEIQEVDNFERIVNSLNATKDVDIYLTGSNSKMLSGEYATLLTGRYKSFNIFPFSLKEMISIHPSIEPKKLLNLYVEYGGFPVIQVFDQEDQKLSVLKDLYDSVVIKDIVQRHQIKNVDILDRYISYLMNTIGANFSAQNIINYFENEGRKISKETLYNYIEYAKNVLLIYPAKRYDVKGKKLLTTNEKYYVNDQGFRAVKFDNTKDIEKILENIVYFELLRRNYTVTVGSFDDKEIDFVAIKDGSIEYYQVTYIMPNPKTRDREFASLLKIKDQYRKYVLSLDDVNFSQEGIIHKNIIDFLLE